MFLLGLYNFGDEVKRVGSALGKNGYAELKKVLAAGKKLPSWSSRTPEDEQTAKSAHAPNLQFVDEEQCEDIQAVVDASEDMQHTVQEFGLTKDLYMVIGVCHVSLASSSAD